MMTDEGKYSKVKNETRESHTIESIKISKQINSGSSDVELTVNGKQHKDNEEEQETKEQFTDRELSNVNNEEKANNTTQFDENDENIMLEKYCCDYWCIQKMKRDTIKPYDEYNKNIKKMKNKTVARLSGDIWALGYVIARKRNRLPCSFVTLLCSIYSVQLLILGVMAWGYSGLPDTVKATGFKGGCKMELENPIITNDNYTISENYTDDSYIVYSDVYCKTLDSWEYTNRRQKWQPDAAILGDVMNNGFQPIFTILSDFTVFIFPITEILSFILLGFYIASSMTNPIIFFIVAHEYNKVNYNL